MSAADADLYYAQLVQHHRICKVCTDAKDCAEGERLLVVWGRADTEAGGLAEQLHDLSVGAQAPKESHP